MQRNSDCRKQKNSEEQKMKKIIMALIAGVIAVGFTACEPTTNVKWTNQNEIDGDYIKEIYWSKDGVEPDTTWSNLSLNDPGEDTDSKSVSELAGQGDCMLEAGGSATIELDPDACDGIKSASINSATLEEGADVNLVIAAAKKK